MSEFWHATAVWTIHSMLAGGTSLLLAWIALRRVNDPARRQQIAAWSLRAAVFVCILTLFPAWLAIPIPGWKAQPVEVEIEPVEEPIPETVRGEPLEFVWVAVEELSEPLAEITPEIPVSVSKSETVIATVAPTPPRDWLAELAPLVLIPYGAFVGFFFLRKLIGHIGLARLRRSATPASSEVQRLASEIADDVRTPRILVSERLASPVCYGVLRPTILLPKSLVKSAKTDELRWVLAHELDHLRRGDPRTGVWLGFARAVYFLLPWFWAVRRELNLAQEYLADAAAAGTQPADYAAFLVELSSGPGVPRSLRALPSLAGVRAGQSDLYRRVTMLLQAKNERKTRWGHAWSAGAIAAAVSTAVLLSGIKLVADDEKPKPKKVIVEVQEKKVAEEKKPDRKTETKPIEVRGVEVKIIEVQKVDTSEIEKGIEEAAKKGDVEGVKKLVARLKAAAVHPPVMATAKTAPAKVAAVPVPPVPPAVAGSYGFTFVAAKDGDVEAIEKGIQKLKAALDEAKDQPEAKAALEKTIAEYRKKIDEAKKKGDWKPVEAAQAAKGKAVEFRDGWNNAGQRDKMLAEFQKNAEVMKARMEKQLSQLKDNPQATDALKEAMKAHEESMAQLKKSLSGLGQLQGQWIELAKIPGIEQPKGLLLSPLTTNKTASQGRFGITYDLIPHIVADQLDLPHGPGVILLSVSEGSVAAKVGLKVNDLLLEVAGEKVMIETLPKVIRYMKADQPFDVVLMRRGKKLTISGITLPEVKADPAAVTTSLSVNVNDDEFMITSKENKTTIEIVGNINDKPSATITISQGDSKKVYQGVQKVPSDLRPKVEKLLGNVSGK